MLCLQAQNIWVILGSSLSLAFCLLLYHRSVQFSHSVVSDSLWPHEPQHARLLCPSPTPGTHPNPCPLSRWCHPTISPSVVPFPPALNLSQHQGLFKWVSSLHQVAKLLEFQFQHQSFQWTPRTDLKLIDSLFTMSLHIAAPGVTSYYLTPG